MKTLLLFILLPLLVISSCLEDKSPVIPSTPLSPEEAQVIANCLTVQQAAEAFAARNNGVYPPDFSLTQNLDGNTLIDLLPGGVYLTNPFTNLATEPAYGVAQLPGQTAYFAVLGGQTLDDYLISGFGETDLLIQLTKDGLVN